MLSSVPNILPNSKGKIRCLWMPVFFLGFFIYLFEIFLFCFIFFGFFHFCFLFMLKNFFFKRLSLLRCCCFVFGLIFFKYFLFFGFSFNIVNFPQFFFFVLIYNMWLLCVFFYVKLTKFFLHFYNFYKAIVNLLPFLLDFWLISKLIYFFGYRKKEKKYLFFVF